MRTLPRASTIRPCAMAVLVLVAGCLGPGQEEQARTDPDDSGPDGTAGSAQSGASSGATMGGDPAGEARGAPANRTALDAPLRQFGCTTHFGLYPVPRDEAQPYLPSGFAPAPFLLPFHVAFLTKTWACPESVLDGSRLGPTATSVYYLPVLPPEELVEEGVASYFVLIGLLSNHSVLADRFASWNLTGSRMGNVSLFDAGAGDASIGEISATEEGFGYVQETQPGKLVASDAFTAHYFGVAGDRVTNVVVIPVGASEVRASGPAHLRFGLGNAPFTTPVLAGTGYHQYWDAGELSYEWISRPSLAAGATPPTEP